MNNFWDDSTTELILEAEQTAQEYEKELEAKYDKTMDDIITMLALLYAKYSVDNTLSYIQLIKTNKYRSIRDEIKSKVEKLKIPTTSENTFIKVYKDSFNILTGKKDNVSMPAKDKIKKKANLKYLGEDYQKRLLNIKLKLAFNLSQQLSIALVKKKTFKELSEAVKKEFNKAKNYSKTIIRTHANLVANEAIFDSFIALGVKQYKYVAILDSRTSVICRDLDGQIFYIKDKEVGINAPPMHYNCRSSIIPVVE